jgi:hypothetical protein
MSVRLGITRGADFFFDNGINKPNSERNSAPYISFGLSLESASEDYQWALRDFPEAVPLRYCTTLPCISLVSDDHSLSRYRQQLPLHGADIEYRPTISPILRV